MQKTDEKEEEEERKEERTGNRLAEARSSQSLLCASPSSFSVLSSFSLAHIDFNTLLAWAYKRKRSNGGARSLARTNFATPCCPGEGISLFWWRMRRRVNPRAWGLDWPTTPSSLLCCAPVLTCYLTAPLTGWVASSTQNGKRLNWIKRSRFIMCATWEVWLPLRQREMAAPRRRWPKSGRGATMGTRVSRWG